MSVRPPVISMRWVVTAATVVLLTAAVVGVGAVSEQHTRLALTRELETRLLLEARNLSLTGAGALLTGLPELTLHPLVREMQTERPELAFVVVLDHRGRIQGHVDARRLGEPYQLPAGLSEITAPMRLAPGERLLASRELLVVEAPVSSVVGQRVGTALVGMKRAYIDRTVAAARRSLVVILAGLLALGIALALVFMSFLLRPIGALRAGLERIGRGDLSTPIRLSDRTELGMLATTVNEMSSQLVVAQREAVEKERLKREVEIAREIQSRLLPAGPHAVGDFVVGGWQRAAAEVGGDYYDLLTLPDGRVGLAIADVSGKGLGGCLVMSMLSAALRGAHARYDSPAALLVSLEQHLEATLRRGEFITMFYGVLEPVSGHLVWASAGHTPPLVYRASSGEVEALASRGIPLGALGGGRLRATLEDRTVELGPGDLMVLFTDGFHEAFDVAGREQFGLDRMRQVVASQAAHGGETVVEALRLAVEAWCGSELPADDETLLVVGRRRQVVALPRPTPAADAAALDPLVALHRAELTGHGIRFAAEIASLEALEPWLERCPLLRELPAEERLQLSSALYEALANVVEHGYDGDATRDIELWWLTDARAGDGSGAAKGAHPGQIAELDARVCAGCFVMRDRGRPFRPDGWRRSDLHDPAMRRRGRGLGLDILHLTLRDVNYHPETEAGNVTLMTFDPAQNRETRKERRHA
jgi:serine phosphatase RsbU (regulator of sigma subunit)